MTSELHKPAAPAPGPRPASRVWWRDLLLIWFGIKCLLFFLGVFVAEVRLDRPFRGVQASFGLWHRWDALHYFAIADRGFDAPETSPTLSWPPLLSWLIRVAAWRPL